MDDVEYTFRIGAFTPDSIPMARLAEYMAALADLVGNKETTHFVRVDNGSAMLVSRVEKQDAPKVANRLAAALSAPTPSAAKAFKIIDDMLAEDNSDGDLRGPDQAVIIPFPGATRPKPLAFPTFKQDGSLDGEILSVGGKTAHAILQDGLVSYSNIVMTKTLAKALGKHLYEKVRLHGFGRWERHFDGTWKLLNFRVDRFEVLDDAPLSEVLTELRTATAESLMQQPDPYHDLMNLRLGEDELH